MWCWEMRSKQAGAARGPVHLASPWGLGETTDKGGEMLSGLGQSGEAPGREGPGPNLLTLGWVGEH